MNANVGYRLVRCSRMKVSTAWSVCVTISAAAHQLAAFMEEAEELTVFLGSGCGGGWSSSEDDIASLFRDLDEIDTYTLEIYRFFIHEFWECSRECTAPQSMVPGVWLRSEC